jgi:hypothetical protein
MKTRTAILAAALTSAALVLAPAAYAAGRGAVEFVLGGYMIAYLQADFLRFGCL